MFDYLIETYPAIAAAKGLGADATTRSGALTLASIGAAAPAGAPIPPLEIDGPAEDEEPEATVTVSHPDPEAATYLNEELSVQTLYELLSNRLVEGRPEDALGLVIDTCAALKNTAEARGVRV